MTASRGRVGVVGLGHIGLPLVAAFASVGYEVTGLDIDVARVRALSEGAPIPIYEPGVEEILRSSASQIGFTVSYEELLERADALVVAVGTPMCEGGGADLSALDDVVERIAAYLRPGVTLVLRSTVPPGTTRRIAATLVARTGLTHGRDFWVGYSPERTLEGRALEDLLSLPNIVGGVNDEAARRVAAIVEPLSGRVVSVPQPEIAELCKLVDNAYRAVNIAFSNEVGQICASLGVDSEVVRAAVTDGHERTQLFQAGLGAGGPCLAKDPLTLLVSASALGVDTPVVGAAVRGNVEATTSVVRAVAEFLDEIEVPDPKVAMLGLAFKGQPPTDDSRGGPAELLYEMLDERTPRPRLGLHDPLVHAFHGTKSADVPRAVEGAHVIAILTNHPALHGLRAADLLSGSARPLLVIDAWHAIADPAALLAADGVRLLRIGDGTVATP